MMHGWKVGYLPSGSFDFMSPEAVCAVLSEIGYDTVEWSQSFANPDGYTDAQLRALVEIPKQFGMEMSEVVMQRDLMVLDPQQRRQKLDGVKEAVRRYGQAGMPVLNLYSGPEPWLDPPVIIGQHLSEGEAWKWLFQIFDELLPVAEQNGIVLCVENVWGMLCHDVYTTRYLLEHYRSPWLGVNLDPSHDILAGHFDMQWLAEQWGSYIKHVHMKDAAGTQRMGHFAFPLLGEGEVDWTAFCKGLHAAGYTGSLSVEFESSGYVHKIWGGDWTKAAKNSYKNLQLLLPERSEL